MNNLVALDTSTEYLSLTAAAGGVVRSLLAQVGPQHAAATLPTPLSVAAGAGPLAFLIGL